MKKRNIIKQATTYNRMIQKEKPFKYHDFLIFIEKINENNHYFGFSTGKKIGNAVTRNRIKRQLKDIVDKKDYKNGFNCIIMVRKGILDKSYLEMKKDLEYCFTKLDLYL